MITFSSVTYDCSLRFYVALSILQLVLDELSAHSAGCSQADDITLVVSKVEASDLVTSHSCREGWFGALIDQVCHLRRSLTRNSMYENRVAQIRSLSLHVEKPV